MKTFYQLERNRRRALHADVWYTGEVLPGERVVVGDWVSAKVTRAVLGRSDSWLHRTAQQHPEIKRSMKQPHQKVGRPLYSLRRIYRILEDSETTKNQDHE